jgi:hypothetical protein
VVTRGRIEFHVAVMGVSMLLAALPARAERLSPALVVTRAPGVEDCPDATGIAARVRAMTHDEPLAPGPTAERDTWLQVEFLQTLSGYRAVITARGRRQGTRSIDDVGPGCASLADAVTLTLVMLLDPELVHATSGLPHALQSDAAASARGRTPSVSFAAEGSGGVTLGILEHGGGFVEAGVRLAFARSLALGVGGGYLFPDRTSAPPGSVTLDLWYGYARIAGAVFEHAGTRLALFLGPSVGSLGGASEGFEYRNDQRLLWVAGAFGVEAFAVLAGSFSWSARLCAVTPFRHEGFSVDDAGERHRAFRTPGIGGALSLGVSVAP